MRNPLLLSQLQALAHVDDARTLNDPNDAHWRAIHVPDNLHLTRGYFGRAPFQPLPLPIHRRRGEDEGAAPNLEARGSQGTLGCVLDQARTWFRV